MYTVEKFYEDLFIFDDEEPHWEIRIKDEKGNLIASKNLTTGKWWRSKPIKSNYVKLNERARQAIRWSNSKRCVELSKFYSHHIGDIYIKNEDCWINLNI